MFARSVGLAVIVLALAAAAPAARAEIFGLSVTGTEVLSNGESQSFAGTNSTTGFNRAYKSMSKAAAILGFAAETLRSPGAWAFSPGFNSFVANPLSWLDEAASDEGITPALDTPPPVPLPAPVLMLLSALAAIGLARWWQRRKLAAA
jgi:hypothetical protein